MNRIYFIPPGTDFDPDRPTADDLNNATDITDYLSKDGVQITPDEALRNRIRAFAESLKSMGFAADYVQELAGAMNAHSYEAAKPAQRAMNTNMKYPTSTPPWRRGRK